MTKIKKVLLAGLLVTSLVPTTVSAKSAKSFAEIYTDCGLGGAVGSLVDGTAGDIFAVVTNIAWDLGTTASTSALTTPETCTNNTALTASLINQGYNKLEKELALGNGQYVEALASLNKTADQTDAQYISSLRSDFSTIVAKNDYSSASHFEKAEKLFNSATK